MSTTNTTAQQYGLSDDDLDALGRELDAIRQEVVDDLGQVDVDYLRSMIRWQRGLEVAASGGHIVQTNSFVTIAHADDAGFVGRLYANGAWFVVDADGAGGCGAVVKGLAKI